ncbi:hypothetical protein WG915_09420 [Corynebacterium sp. H128]
MKAVPKVWGPALKAILTFGAITVLTMASFGVAAWALDLGWNVVVPGLAVSAALAYTVSLLALFRLARSEGVTALNLGLVAPGRKMWHLLWQIPVVVFSAALVQGGCLAVFNFITGMKADTTNDPAAYDDWASSESAPQAAILCLLLFYTV